MFLHTGFYSHAFAISFYGMRPDDVQLSLVELYDILLRRIAEDELPQISEHEHGDAFRCLTVRLGGFVCVLRRSGVEVK